MEKICVVGAGTMGWGIAQAFAAGGYEVLLTDREQTLAQKGKATMEKRLLKQVEKGKMEQADAEALLGRVTPCETGEVSGCVLAVEAIYENMDAKQAVLRQLEALLPKDAILASNTSSLSITEIASAVEDPSRVIGMHFFNPASIMKLVEVISGAHTSDDVKARTVAMAQSIGKTPVEVQESAGFVVNRILIPMINEAAGILAEGVASAEDIDTAMKLGANHPMGPLALGDLIGLDVCLAIMEVLQGETGDPKFRPHPLLRKMVRAGRLGRKTGRGFFSY